MKNNTQLLLSTAIALSSVSMSTQAIDLNYGGTDYGKLIGAVKAMHILDAKNNGYDPNDGTSYLLKLKYLTPRFSGFQLGLAGYTNGNLFKETRFDYGSAAGGATDRTARGMFTNLTGQETTVLGEAYIDFKNKKVKARVGRQMLKTPLTTITYSQTPNFYTAYGISTTALEGFNLGIMQITEMSQGARTVTDWSLIGEGTNTAGTAIPTHVFGQSEFNDISEATLGPGAASTDGITAVNVEYTGFKMVKLAAWNHYVDEIANNFYFQADSTIPVGGYKLALSGQVLNQDDVGSSLAGGLDFTLVGAKATLKGKGWSVFLAANSSSGSTAMLNAWGGDPAYTSSIFSRNAYREDVNAFKIGFKYKIMKDLVFLASHANYGESDTSPMSAFAGIIPAGAIPNMGKCIGGTTCVASNDATETDLVLLYKPSQVKGLLVKLFHARRESEYNDAHALELKQAHTRLIAAYKF